MRKDAYQEFQNHMLVIFAQTLGTDGKCVFSCLKMYFEFECLLELLVFFIISKE